MLTIVNQIMLITYSNILTAKTPLDYAIQGKIVFLFNPF